MCAAMFPSIVCRSTGCAILYLWLEKNGAPDPALGPVIISRRSVLITLNCPASPDGICPKDSSTLSNPSSSVFEVGIYVFIISQSA